MESPIFTLRQRSITLAEYHKMAEVGILTEDERIELLHGQIIPMSPVGSKHSTCVKRLNRLFSRSVGDRAIISVQDPIQIPEQSEPEPDVALLYPPLTTYETRHPLPDEVMLVIEVSDSSLLKDHTIKLPLYASAGMPEVWLIDLPQQQVEVYTKPQDDIYTLRRLVRKGETITLVALDLAVSVDEVFG
jgi:Uma2 family endonuclease